jgi:hypothetical protein
MTCIGRAALLSGVLLAASLSAWAQPQNASPPSSPVRLVFVHHSTGQNWLADGDGRLGIALRDNSYFVSDTNYGWGPERPGGGPIGDTTDIGHWYDWFSGPQRDTYVAALYAESAPHSSYSRLATNPGGENRVVLFKSCFPNSALGGSPSDPVPPIEANPLRGEDAGSAAMTVANAKGIYVELLKYFRTRVEKLFVVVTAPPLVASSTSPAEAANARAFNDWLVQDWLDGYPYRNVAVVDFFDVLTSNGGSTRTNNPNVNDLGWADGNHHRFRNGAVEHTRTVANHVSAYGSGGGSDSHPTAAGNLKATGELVSLVNVAYHCWKGDGGCPNAPAPVAGAPFGAFDTPSYGATGVAGAIPVTGWALDDAGVTKVEIYRNPVAGEATQPSGHVYLGDATFVPGARPDVAAAYPGYPNADRAGWGYMLLTNMLPGTGNGPFVLLAYARDAAGHATLLGAKAIACANASASKPFGTLDTPAQGATVSGAAFVVFGWALTPLPAAIPTNGSTLVVYVDGAPLGHPVYDQYRSDIATLFPGYANSNGAVGYFVLDTRTLANGLHSIAWSATDDLARSDGLGSRYFWVAN